MTKQELIDFHDRAADQRARARREERAREEAAKTLLRGWPATMWLRDLLDENTRLRAQLMERELNG